MGGQYGGQMGYGGQGQFQGQGQYGGQQYGGQYQGQQQYGQYNQKDQQLQMKIDQIFSRYDRDNTGSLD